ncbi:sugar ABC transporter ATP-binding protein [Galbitalea sp. SE-J8]|uniref:sugar ABC transporter ATP-binding protein n=1 Tax=Galbitalea sp. SE-J8 TaxID=3054952 RepID=UPI00259CACA2|nr:sugar ABC transporter ATP-binding protein [Galbitalea sp. SE-J8]MDM4763010.1 sugar ABC transporter ATP-binding protein [Galbitalea sp. SE-J8]
MTEREAIADVAGSQPVGAIPLLEIRNLNKSFYATRAVRDVSLTIDQGEIVSLLGENGAGKSTVIKMLAGVYRPDSGEILLSGANVDDPGVRKQVSIVHQNLGLIDWMTVSENIAQVLGYPKRAGFISSKGMTRQAEEVLATVGGGIDPDARIFDLPRTERSLLAIARALVSKPKLLVLDEPTASLPQADVERLFDVLRTLRNTGVGMIYVSHRLDEIYEISSRTIVMRNGAVVGNRRVEGLSHGELVQLIVGHDTVNPAFDPPHRTERLRLDDVVIGAIGPVSLSAREGEVVALCGLRGAGQEQLGRAIVGATKIDSGRMTLSNERFAPRSPHHAVARGVGFATSNRETESVGAGLSVTENLFLNPQVWSRKWWQFSKASTERRTAYEYIRRFGVRPDDPDLPLDTFSGGNQQKVILARWFGVGRTLVVLEEPTMGVDVGVKGDIYLLLRDAAREGTTAVVVSTDMEEVATIAHRAIVFGRGKVVAEISGPDLTIANLVAAASNLDRRAELEGPANESDPASESSPALETAVSTASVLEGSAQ